MRAFSYSAILGATVIFIVVISSLLWAEIYEKFNNYISTQIVITTKLSYVQLNNFSYDFLSIKNISGFDINITNQSDIYIYQYINKQIEDQNLPWHAFQLNHTIFLEYYIPYNITVKNTGLIKDFEIKNLMIKKVMSLQKLDFISFLNNSTLTPRKTSVNDMFNYLNDMRSPFYDVLLNNLKTDYSNIVVKYNKKICDLIENEISLSPGTSYFYNSEGLSYINIAGEFVNSKDQCYLVLDSLSERVKDQVFLRNCMSDECNKNNGVFLIPYYISINFTKKYISGKLVCSYQGNVISRPKELPEEYAKTLCQEASNIKNTFCSNKEESLEQELGSCSSITKINKFLECMKGIVNSYTDYFGIYGCVLDNCLNKNFKNCVENCFEMCFNKEITLTLNFYYIKPKVFVKFYVYDTNYISTDPENPNKMYILYFKTEKIYNVPINFME